MRDEAACKGTFGERRGWRSFRELGLVFIVGLALITVSSCARTNVENVDVRAAGLPRPQLIIVHDFAVSADAVALDSAIGARALEAVKGEPEVQAHIKVGAEVAILENLWLGADVISVSGTYLRGDEANQQPKLGGYTLLNLGLRYVPVKQVELWGRVDNVTNARYGTSGALNWNAFADPISVQRFVAPGAPIGGWAGVKVRF